MTPDYVSADGSVTLYCGDCRTILPHLSGVDAVVTDPPYGLNIDYSGEYKDSLLEWENVVPPVIEMCRTMARRTVCFMGITNLFSLPRPDWVAGHVWRTTGCFGKLGVNQWMPIAVYGRDIDGFGSVNGVIKSDVIMFDGGDGVGFLRDTAADKHPCPKPTNVMTRILRRFTSPQEIVCDPFLGSGTTGVACVRLGRKFIGIEIDPGYFKIAVKRIEQAFADQALFVPQPQEHQAEMFAEATA